jgi:hypothetical protein
MQSGTACSGIEYKDPPLPADRRSFVFTGTARSHGAQEQQHRINAARSRSEP